MKTNWIPGIAVFVAAFISALAFVFFSRKSKESQAVDDTSDDFEARYQSTIAALKTHHANKHLLPLPEWEAEKSRLEIAATSALKAKQNQSHEELKREARLEKKAQTKPFLPPMLSGGLIGAAVVSFFFFLVKELPSLNSVPEMPPENAPMQKKPMDDSKMKNMVAKVEANPMDIDATSDLAIYLLKRQGFNEASILAARTANIDPFHVRGRIVREVVKAINGEIAPSLLELERLADVYPEANTGRFFTGMLALELEDKPRALRQFDLYLANAAPGEAPPMMRMAIEDLRREMNGAGQ
jgi:hypothetical protein